MNNIAKDVRQAVYTALNALNYNGGNLPVHLVVPDPPVYPYLVLEGVSMDNTSSQVCVEAMCRVTIEAVSAWQAGGGGMNTVDDIETLVCAALDPIASPVMNKHFGSKFVTSSHLKDYDGARVIIRKRIEFEISTEQLTT